MLQKSQRNEHLFIFTVRFFTGIITELEFK